MYSADIVYKKNDRRPFVDITLTDANGVVDLTNVDVKQIMQEDATGDLILNSSCEIIFQATTAGVVRWQPSSSASALTGHFRMSFQGTFADGRPATFPNDDYLTVLILEDLD